MIRKIIILGLSLNFLLFLTGCSWQKPSNDRTLLPQASAESQGENVSPNMVTSFIPSPVSPSIDPSAYIHPRSMVIGDVRVGKNVFVGPFASLRGDEGVPIHIGDNSNVQDGAVLHALETNKDGKAVEENLMEYQGKKYAVYIGSGVSLAHQSQVHGPALVEDNVFVGMQSLIFKARIGEGCVIEPGAKIIGVNIPAGRYVPAGQAVTKQSTADKLPVITKGYGFFGLNAKVLHVNKELAEAYKKGVE